MDELRRIVSFIDKYAATSNPLLSLSDDSTLETKLFSLLKQGSISSDVEAAQELYGTTKITSSYRMLKSRFRKKLFNQLHFLKLTQTDLAAFEIANYECKVLMSQAAGLRVMSEYNLSIKLLDQALQIAESSDINRLKIHVLEDKQMMLLDMNDDKLYVECEALLQSYYTIQEYERQALGLYSRAIMAIRGPVTERANIISRLSSTIEHFKLLVEKSTSSYVFRYYHILRIIYLEQTGQYAEIVVAVEQAEKLIQTKRLNEKWFNLKYNKFIQVYALLQSRQYDYGLKVAGENLALFRKYEFNWFSYLENYVLLALHSKKHLQVEQLLQEVTQNRQFEKLPESSRERWELYRRYFLLLHRFSADAEEVSEPPMVIKELTVLPKDKAGFNLALLVLDVFEGLSKSDSDELELYAERVRKYTSKYLKGRRRLGHGFLCVCCK
ncbi:hypothetical protein GCM10028895_04460 [Pontibacter rugosus]